MEFYVCDHCGQTFLVENKSIELNIPLYCCKDCEKKAREKRLKERELKINRRK